MMDGNAAGGERKVKYRTRQQPGLESAHGVRLYAVDAGKNNMVTKHGFAYIDHNIGTSGTIILYIYIPVQVRAERIGVGPSEARKS